MSNPAAAGLDATLIDALAMSTSHDAHTITRSTVLKDIDIDSLALAAVILDIEEASGKELSKEVLARLSTAKSIKTVGDLAELLGID